MAPRIIIVDDEKEWSELLLDSLRSENYSIETAESYEAASRALMTNHFKLAILDIRLVDGNPKNKDGLRLLADIDKSNLDTKVIIVTGYGTKEDEEIARQSPKVQSFIYKNKLDLIELVQILSKALVPIQSNTEVDKLDYSIEDQPWYTSKFPATINIGKKQIDKLKDEIDIVIMTATEIEIRSVINLLQHYPRFKSILKVPALHHETYYVGKFGKYQTVITKCEMGSIPPNAATLATDQALRLWQPRACIMVGIAFGRDKKKQTIGDVLVSSEIFPYDPIRMGEHIIYKGQSLPSDFSLRNLFANAYDWDFKRPDGMACKILIGQILSGEKLIDNPYFKSTLFQPFPNAIGGEMEGAGFSSACVRAGVPWILVKSICDWADGKKDNKHQALAAAAAASLVHHVLSNRDALDSL